jgi:glycine/D-amino acid oxidase-like deaminating enzyme
VGSGITGLVAAIHLARGGRQVTVFEAKEPGHGASTRNAGYVGRTLKHSFGEIMESQGLDKARAVYGELMEAFLAVKETVEQEKIQCHYKQQGRLLLATSPAMYEAMAREFALREKHLGEPFDGEPGRRSATRLRPTTTSAACAFPTMPGSIRASTIKGLLDAARDAGVAICAFTPVLGFRKEAEDIHRVREGREGFSARADLRHEWLWRQVNSPGCSGASCRSMPIRRSRHR